MPSSLAGGGKWVGKKADQIGFVLRSFGSFAYLISPLKIGRKTVETDGRTGNRIEIESSLTRESAEEERFRAEIGPPPRTFSLDKVPNGQKSTFFTGMEQFGVGRRRRRVARPWLVPPKTF